MKLMRKEKCFKLSKNNTNHYWAITFHKLNNYRKQYKISMAKFNKYKLKLGI